MKRLSVTALGAGTLLACSCLLAVPAVAQTAAAAPAYSLTKAERAGLNPLVTAVRAGNYAAAQAALPAARGAASSTYARYLVAAEQLRLGVATNNVQLQGDAMETMLDSGLAPASEVPKLLINKASLELSAGKRKQAESTLTRLLELQPNNIDALETVAKLRTDQRDYKSATMIADRMVQIYKAANQPVSESLYKYGLNYATMSAQGPQAMKFAYQLVAAYPTNKNWRDALLVYRDMAKPDPAAELDLWRLMRASKSMAGERDYLSFADMLSRAGLSSESKEVLGEGAQANFVDPSKGTASTLRKTVTTKAAQEAKGLAAKEKAAMAAATGTQALAVAETHFGLGNYAKAAEYYRAAAQKGSVDPNLTSTRLGMALGLAGQRAEAEAALRSVTGPRADLAAFVLLWLSQRG